MPSDHPTTEDWGWNGDICAVWGKAIIIGDTREEKEATARLFAAAPAMRKELERLRKWASKMGYVDTAARITTALGE